MTWQLAHSAGLRAEKDPRWYIRLNEARLMSSPAPGENVLRFADFELHQRAGELYKTGRKIRLQALPLRILATLLETPGQVVTRDELREKLWPADTFVDFDHSLNTAIRKLRRALNDEADTPRFIETLPRRGYRFVGAAPTGNFPAPSVASAPPAVATPATDLVGGISSSAVKVIRTLFLFPPTNSPLRKRKNWKPQVTISVSLSSLPLATSSWSRAAPA